MMYVQFETAEGCFSHSLLFNAGGGGGGVDVILKGQFIPKPTKKSPLVSAF